MLKPRDGLTDSLPMAERPQEARRSPRQFRPLSCEIEIGGRVHSGVIRDLTRQGLFVTSRFEAAQGAQVIVRVRRPGGEIWNILATAARSDDGARGMVSRRGLGLVVEEAPEAFHEFVAELEEKRTR